MDTTSQTSPEAPVRVTVVVPTHNTGEKVLTGLRSFLEQTLPRAEFEVLYVDDGSTDDTVRILEEEIAARGAGDTVRVLRMANSGWPGRPRNAGTDAARGEFVHYVDDDDWLAPEALERLYARARETGADIVAGRMAGHGRKVPRELFEKPRAAADLRQDTALLAAMTVHKLFRRGFLVRHGLRFAEGPVRLEDHLFMLRAYLLTDRVATVHDHTCYHWVRHPGDARQNISFRPIEPGPYIDSVRRVLDVLDAPDTCVPPGRHRNRLTAKWYGKKALDRITGRNLLDLPEECRAEWFEAVASLAADLPPQADAALPTRLRIVAALARHGDRQLLEEFAAFDARVDHRPRVRAAEWADGRLTVRCATGLVRKAGGGASSGPVFTGTPERLRLRLPPRVAAVPGAAGAADFTRAVRRGTVRGQLRHRESGTELNVETTWRLAAGPREAPPARGLRSRVVGLLRRAAGRPTGPGGAPGRPEPQVPQFEAEFTVDPATADRGGPLAPGTWEVRLQLGCGGWRTARTLPGLTLQAPATRPEPRLPGPRRPAATRTPAG
ncbi:glycosyltransferase family 2 protein [Streptomyces sp. HNM0574]|uniref:glycosyltransferase n=1 Tax=Streptomyces sp. HNM0574 TaxID=2714954 RepID=UPI00146C350C|nr:glycosyltransferase family 2 protein [Streptomyces sp. HNM0574]